MFTAGMQSLTFVVKSKLKETGNDSHLNKMGNIRRDSAYQGSPSLQGARPFSKCEEGMSSQQADPYISLDDLEIKQDTYLEDFRTHLLPAIRPAWKDQPLDSKVFDSGITNALVAIFLKEKGLKGSRDDVILVRMNGIGTEIIIDRTDELVCLVELNKVGLFPPVHAKFRNGLCYGFYPGRQVGVAEVREEGISKKIACVLARLHCVDIPQHFRGRGPVLWRKVRGGASWDQSCGQKCLVI